MMPFLPRASRQGQAADDGWQDHRKGGDRPQQRQPGELDSGLDPGQRQTE